MQRDFSLTVDAADKQYICPGQTHPISRAVHLSRLAAFFPDCRNCPLRTDTGHLPKQTIERLQRTERRVPRRSLFSPEGVRGVYLNELTRLQAGRFAETLASLLWDEAPLTGRRDNGRSAGRRTGPIVVVGFDERPSSPDIVTGVTAALRRMACQVVDIGLTTKPCFWFTADHVQAAAGIFVTGAGREMSWTGLDIVGRETLPMSLGTGLEQIEARLEQPFQRPTRHSGSQRMFQAAVPYEAGLWKHFHALRPLTVCCGCPVRQVRRTLRQLFARLPCRLKFIPIPDRPRQLDADDDPDVQTLSRAIREADAHLGLLINDDAQCCAFVDEAGVLIPARQITRLIANVVLSNHPGHSVVIEEESVEPLRPLIEDAGGVCIGSGSTAGELSRTMRAHNAVFAGGDSGRFWFRENIPTSDAILTLARILEALSRSDTPFSEAARQTTATS